MIVFKFFLFPFAVLYNLVTQLRNHLYNIGHKKSFQFEAMVISVGNLNLGGSGKTPMIEYLIRLLKSRYTIATLSRGYGRRSRGLKFVTEDESAATIGDEPFQLFKKFEDIQVIVGEDRAFAIPHILQQYPATDVILMDDAFQHRSVIPQLSILLSGQNKPFFKDYLLPMGRLREARAGASRADIVVITKCSKDVNQHDRAAIIHGVKKYSGEKPVFFSGLEYGKPVAIGGHKMPLSNQVIVVSGIANPVVFEKYVASQFGILRHFKFQDHHSYTIEDIKQIIDFYRQQGSPSIILTTEKDMVRLLDSSLKEWIEGFPWFFIPISTGFVEDGPDFDNLIIQSIEKFRSAKQ